MARRNKVEACMFCGAMPCECNAKPKPERKPRTKKPVEQGELIPVPDYVTPTPKPAGPFAGFKHPTEQLAAADPFAPVEMPPTPDPVEAAKAEAAAHAATQDGMAAAMAVIRDAGILDPVDQRRVEREYPRTPDPRAEAWRKRNAVSQ